MLWNIFSHIYDKDSFFPMIVHFEGARDAVQKKNHARFLWKYRVILNMKEKHTKPQKEKIIPIFW